MTHMLRGLCLLICTLMADVAMAISFDVPINGDNVVGQLYYVIAKEKDTLVDLANSHNVGYDEIKRANPGVDPWLPGEGTRVLIPSLFILPGTTRTGLVLNLSEQRIYYYPEPRLGHPRKVFTYPVGIGRDGWETPIGMTKIVRKRENPTWTPPESIRKEHAAKGDILPDVVPGGVDNPLGTRAMYLGIEGYLIHGTNKPAGAGMRVSHGCIRMPRGAVEELFDLVPEGTPVELIDMPVKFGLRDRKLYFESHLQTPEELAELEAEKAKEIAAGNIPAVPPEPTKPLPPGVVQRPPMPDFKNRAVIEGLLLSITGGSRNYTVDWALVDSELQLPKAIPAEVGGFTRPAGWVAPPLPSFSSTPSERAVSKKTDNRRASRNQRAGALAKSGQGKVKAEKEVRETAEVF